MILSEYAGRWRHLDMTRDEAGVLTATLHDGGDVFTMSAPALGDIAGGFRDIAADPANRVVVLTAAGDAWCSGLDAAGSPGGTTGRFGFAAAALDAVQALLAVRVPVIAAVPGPAVAFGELAFACDLVLAAESASFGDAHFDHGLVPGGAAIALWQDLLGPIGASGVLISGRTFTASEALARGVVQEVLPAGRLMSRAREHASRLAAMHDISLHGTRVTVANALRQRLEREAPAVVFTQSLATLDRELVA